jgi:hypothetical protein
MTTRVRKVQTGTFRRRRDGTSHATRTALPLGFDRLRQLAERYVERRGDRARQHSRMQMCGAKKKYQTANPMTTMYTLIITIFSSIVIPTLWLV